LTKTKSRTKIITQQNELGGTRMGLDNGIEIKRNEKSMNIYDKLQRFESDWCKKYGYNFEVCYYRKCWNIRARIFECLTNGFDNSSISVTREDIPNIIAMLKSLNADNWNDYGSSIWEFEEQEPHIKRHIENLEYLYELMAEHDLDVYFYDSY
jgi:hypothetical protein